MIDLSVSKLSTAQHVDIEFPSLVGIFGNWFFSASKFLGIQNFPFIGPTFDSKPGDERFGDPTPATAYGNVPHYRFGTCKSPDN